jgi:hypothetical protein
MMPLPQGMLTHHVQYCRPYCNSCYRNCVVTRRPRTRREAVRAPDCKCAPHTTNPNFVQRWFNSPAYYAKNKLDPINRMICQDCKSHSPKELIAMKEMKSKLELKRGLQWDGTKWTKCAKCEEALGVGPRWWVCGKDRCEKECRSIAHKGFGRREKDDGSFEGDEAV